VASEASLVADQYGYVHCFWTETLYTDGRTVIKYARFDGTAWTRPNDIYVTEQSIRNISPFVDQHGMLYITWAEGLFGPAYYSYAPAYNALFTQNWAEPRQIKIPARFVYMRVDSKGIFHLLYINQTENAGVYYIRSEDRGMSWSDPLWLDPDIPPGTMPDSLSFQLDQTDGLHATWFYGARDLGARAGWVRYTHSLDGGHTWSAPFTIDRQIEGSDHDLAAASPVMTVQGQTVYVIWAAGSQPYRNYRFSSDAGLTWSLPVQIFGQLQGQAFDGLTVDGSGRVHYFAQIRYPIGIYHAYWDHDRWSNASLVYLIAPQDSPDGIGNRIHAHFTHPVVRAGNQLVLTFTDPPAELHRRLFVMLHTLDDISPLETIPTPVLLAMPSPMASPTPTQSVPTPKPTATPPSLVFSDSPPLGHEPAPDMPIRVALVPTLLALAGAAVVWLRKRGQ
jgi:hypothetical protein